MKKIYVHSFLVMYFDHSTTLFDNLSEVPAGCDFVAYSLHDNTNFKHITNFLLSRSKFVLIDLDELTFVDVLNDAEQLLSQHKNLKIISQIQSNRDSKIQFSGHWFMSPINFYSYNTLSKWADNFLKQLSDDYSDRPYMFDCLLGRQKEDRDYIEKMYQSSQHKDKIFFTYYKDDIKQGVWDFPVDAIVSSAQLVNYKKHLFAPVEHIVPSVAIPVSVYNQTYYSLVSETLILNEYSFYTEKIAKPILAKRPFIVFSGQHYLKNLKILGFKTFDTIIDESYDNISDYHERAAAAWYQVEQLILQNPLDIYHQTKDIREHNYNLFRSTDWTKNTKQIISQMLSSNGPAA